jgi:hypothetical protein
MSAVVDKAADRFSECRALGRFACHREPVLLVSRMPVSARVSLALVALGRRPCLQG